MKRRDKEGFQIASLGIKQRGWSCCLSISKSKRWNNIVLSYPICEFPLKIIYDFSRVFKYNITCGNTSNRTILIFYNGNGILNALSRVSVTHRTRLNYFRFPLPAMEYGLSSINKTHSHAKPHPFRLRPLPNETMVVYVFLNDYERLIVSCLLVL